MRVWCTVLIVLAGCSDRDETTDDDGIIETGYLDCMAPTDDCDGPLSCVTEQEQSVCIEWRPDVCRQRVDCACMGEWLCGERRCVEAGPGAFACVPGPWPDASVSDAMADLGVLPDAMPLGPDGSALPDVGADPDMTVSDAFLDPPDEGAQDPDSAPAVVETAPAEIVPHVFAPDGEYSVRWTLRGQSGWLAERITPYTQQQILTELPTEPCTVVVDFGDLGQVEVHDVSRPDDQSVLRVVAWLSDEGPRALVQPVDADPVGTTRFWNLTDAPLDLRYWDGAAWRAVDGLDQPGATSDVVHAREHAWSLRLGESGAVATGSWDSHWFAYDGPNGPRLWRDGLARIDDGPLPMWSDGFPPLDEGLVESELWVVAGSLPRHSIWYQVGDEPRVPVITLPRNDRHQAYRVWLPSIPHRLILTSNWLALSGLDPATDTVRGVADVEAAGAGARVVHLTVPDEPDPDADPVVVSVTDVEPAARDDQTHSLTVVSQATRPLDVYWRDALEWRPLGTVEDGVASDQITLPGPGQIELGIDPFGVGIMPFRVTLDIDGETLVTLVRGWNSGRPGDIDLNVLVGTGVEVREARPAATQFRPYEFLVRAIVDTPELAARELVPLSLTRAAAPSVVVGGLPALASTDFIRLDQPIELDLQFRDSGGQPVGAPQSARGAVATAMLIEVDGIATSFIGYPPWRAPVAGQCSVRLVNATRSRAMFRLNIEPLVEVLQLTATEVFAPGGATLADVGNPGRPRFRLPACEPGVATIIVREDRATYINGDTRLELEQD